MHEHRYKFGKQKAIMTVENFKEKLEACQEKLLFVTQVSYDCRRPVEFLSDFTTS
jgi:hypothetical protein